MGLGFLGTKQMKKIAGITAAALAAFGSANAATIMDMFTVDTTRTNFDILGELAQFDPSLGTLNKIDFILEGDVAGTAAVESLDNAPSTIEANLSATITLRNSVDPMALVELVVVIPAVNANFNATAYDGTIDFDGTSGATFNSLMGTADETESLTDAADFAPYIGLGTFAISIEALGNSSASGSGNLITQFSTFAAAKAKVVYHFTPDGQIPVPGALILMGTALAGFGASRRKNAA